MSTEAKNGKNGKNGDSSAAAAGQLKMEFLPPKSNEFFSLDSREIEVREELNLRQDYGDIESIAKSILLNCKQEERDSKILNTGIKTPISCFKENKRWVVIRGFRRMRACALLNKQGYTVRVPLISAGRPEDMKITEILLQTMLTDDNNKKLNAIELADGVKRLIKEGMSESDVAKRTGYSPAYISNLKLLDTATKKIKDAIIGEKISPTLVIITLRKSVDGVKVLESILDKKESGELDEQPEETGGKKKKKKNYGENQTGRQAKKSKNRVTAKDLEENSGGMTDTGNGRKEEINGGEAFGEGKKHDSIKHLKKLIQSPEFDSTDVRKENEAIFEFCFKLVSGDFSYEALEELLYVPKKK